LPKKITKCFWSSLQSLSLQKKSSEKTFVSAKKEDFSNHISRTKLFKSLSGNTLFARMEQSAFLLPGNKTGVWLPGNIATRMYVLLNGADVLPRRSLNLELWQWPHFPVNCDANN